ncbi:Holliday junction branch migration protein RuvA [Elizabethkingia sp. JS20170427COW]|uniref:Holliday junction branch migration protein RuvA n=1 Tax=Elizabethkingia sp. JS20170427COW TaxID=2583851 RepID=UPI001110F62B|nr:Holliday junction branch migration protein RuvA [Elizabethkingia sp. JS20170427COW]QCX52861.1 Holliday junction branch migration protein RuvA [Elizabethkingia sp. JS20170427COW]
MIHFLRGIAHELTPTYVVVDVNGVGYYVGISLLTSQKLQQGKEVFLHTQQVIREDAQLLYGFYTVEEKEIFNLLIGVNGVGAVSALILLSTLEISEIASAICSRNSVVLQKAKGIGGKTAERIIVDLKDKVQKFTLEDSENSSITDNKIKSEALTALEVLGIPRKTAEKAADKVLKLEPEIDLETLIKKILKNI